MKDETLLEMMAASPSLSVELGDHDPEVCGMCFQRNLNRVVAKEILDSIRNGENAGKPDAFEGALKRYEEETNKRWMESKFVKLWVAEKEAGRDPHKAFEERGWQT